MDRDKIMDAMNHMDPALVEGADLPVKRRRRWARPALIAACLCLVLAGTALAVELAGVSLGDFYDKSETIDGEERVVSCFDIQASGVRSVPLDSLSQKMRDMMADTENLLIEKKFYSWEEIETFLGMELEDNAVLDGLMQGPIGIYADGLCKAYRWTLRIMSAGRFEAAAHYECQGRNVVRGDKDGSSIQYTPGTGVTVTANIFTEQGELEDDFVTCFQFLSEEGVTFQREDYVTHSGVTVPAVYYTFTFPVGGSFERPAYNYAAYFVLDGILYEVNANGDESQEAARALLEQVLDGYGEALSGEKQPG